MCSEDLVEKSNSLLLEDGLSNKVGWEQQTGACLEKKNKTETTHVPLE